MPSLSTKQWLKIKPLLPQQNFKNGGRPRSDDLKILNGIIWILRTGAQWNEMPSKYGHYSTAWRRLNLWMQNGTWDLIWKKLLKELKDSDLLHLEATSLDATFSPAKKGAIK